MKPHQVASLPVIELFWAEWTIFYTLLCVCKIQDRHLVAGLVKLLKISFLNGPKCVKAFGIYIFLLHKNVSRIISLHEYGTKEGRVLYSRLSVNGTHAGW